MYEKEKTAIASISIRSNVRSKLKQVLIRNFVFDKITYNFALDSLNWNNVFCFLATLWAVTRNKHVEREHECVVYLENEIKI